MTVGVEEHLGELQFPMQESPPAGGGGRTLFQVAAYTLGERRLPAQEQVRERMEHGRVGRPAILPEPACAPEIQESLPSRERASRPERGEGQLLSPHDLDI